MLEEIMRFAKDILELILKVIFHYPIGTSVLAVIIGLITILVKLSGESSYPGIGSSSSAIKTQVGAPNKNNEPGRRVIIPPFDRGAYDKGMERK